MSQPSHTERSTRRDDYPHRVVPPGRYAQNQRAPIVWVRLCAGCAGFAPFTEEDYEGYCSGRCAGCGLQSRELHRYRAWIDSAAGCAEHDCAERHGFTVVGDIDGDVERLRAILADVADWMDHSEGSARLRMTEVRDLVRVGLGEQPADTTVAVTYYRAACAACGQGPDLDGEEYDRTPAGAVRAVLDAEVFSRMADGRLLCENCTPGDEDDDVA
jgi:hypothetical protein